MDDRRQMDMEYFNKWKETGDKIYFQKLYRGLRGYLDSAINKSSYGSNLPKSVFELEAAQQFHDALNRFKPSKGAALQTFVYSAVQDKLKRTNAKYQNLARIPERASGGVFQIGVFNNEKAFLEEKLGREPSAQELADGLNWSVKAVERLLQEDRKDLSLNAELEDLNTFDDFAAEQDELAAKYYDMNPEEQLVFDYATGMHGKQPILKKNGREADWDTIARQLNMTPQKVQKIRKKLVSKVRDF